MRSMPMTAWRGDEVLVQGISRRRALAYAAALLGAGLLPGLACARALPRSRFGKLGIQLYMLGPEVAQNLGPSLEAVARIGYREVELPGFYNKSPSELRAALDAAGLSCPSIHVPGRFSAPGTLTLADDIGRISDAAAVLGARTLIMPLFLLPEGSVHPLKPGEDVQAMLAAVSKAMTADEWKRTAEFLNEKAAILARSDLQLGYHNHNAEFAPLPEGGTGFDLLMKHTDPKLVMFELDVGWAAAGGVQPVDLLHRFPGRFRMLHLKDLKPTPANFVFQLNPADVGAGIIDWPALLRAAHGAGIQHYFVEQEPPFERPQIDSARIAFDFLQKPV